VKGGRFFADFGRLPHWHDEALPFVDRPPSIERMFGGETQAEGAQVTWLAPTDQYISFKAGIFNVIGADPNEQLRNEGFPGYRSFSELTFLAHPSTYFDLSDTLNLEVGSSFFTVPRDGQRYLYGLDATLRHQPGTSELYQGLVLGSEWYWNNERFANVDPVTGAPLPGNERFHRNGGYAYLETFFGRRYSVGLRGDYAVDLSGESSRQITSSVFATWFPSEFQRLRFQFDQINEEHGQNDQRFTLQWTAFLGSHSHGFTTR